MSEELPISDFVDHSVEASLKKSFSELHLALRVAIYAVDASQSLVKDVHSLTLALSEGVECSCLFAKMETQAKFLANVSCDILKASASAMASSVLAHRHVYLRDWKVDSAHKSGLLHMPFTGSHLLGADLEHMLH
ncbi:hypothetical protein NDU88_004282 [Pleurodeles waltl]|uniref:Lamina-associated polypeptide 2 alpha C-terminal domain-containing protein n=1 Tax=Pleurodeles waltl TaxID=8319 RepID=A0AAV7MDM0_PLEWA|nr:hypothetical protein NDU88_004282 [Pleurodeles waltl]